ncbi:5-methyltetrahydropteroyltriglutamate--homocysteine S-methyltransferase [Lacticaseibacillus paracasei]|uniref:5-methyltetrahydropteroyltriglutamate--homocysteine methyltransferase n=1 Tax=Lacticaseibacillus paracasei TaxID=1597 RepID=A0A422M042_LACPA|nr:5-methyltetrahydropteroyltriglutamate--homocysteine S-methyltransferase [Lacticaseibacillus paracasei]RDG25452.1 5-methyltetrahydropteroyltriglutamate--homocysteine S-methyltransferase [Lacticaseibacillus paracasei]RND79985.1 5-methyltetrahydropteroyltriglutamate--homocysteine methyltransferase [Lacticaseibacillus paracasei]
MTTTIIGYPRIGEHRELKFATQKYFKHQITAQELQEQVKALRQHNWETVQAAGIDQIPTGDFSFFDNTLDVANLLNIVPKRYQALGLSPLDTYFAQARGYQGDAGDVKALAMKKWFNTNYHYLVPEFDQDTQIKVTDWQLFDQFEEAKALGINARPTLVGPYTLLKLSRFIDVTPDDFVTDLIAAYTDIIGRLHAAGAEWIQVDEPALVYDQTDADLALFERLYTPLLAQKQSAKVLVQTYFGDLTDSFDRISKLPFDGFGLDFVEGHANLDLLKTQCFPADATLFAGIINGKNIWRTHYADALATIKTLAKITDKLVLSTSTSLLHVPYTLRNETHLKPEEKQYLAFAEEKLSELHELDAIFETGADHKAYQTNVALFSKPRYAENKALNEKIAALTPDDYTRTPERKTRLAIQAKAFKLPLLPTTTIGSFPQTAEVRRNRAKLRRHEITEEQYTAFNHKEEIKWIRFQEEIGLDVLVHGEFERNDMVEYFGENFGGFRFTDNGWVQSYGTRGVKPPIIWGDVYRTKPITVAETVFAQSQTDHLVKGMLTGPVTIYNWSFPREDLSQKTSVEQIALALEDEVLDLEKHGIKIIQIDEPALRENLPLRKKDWYPKYLDWAVPAFRLVGSKVKPETQIHTHMCYSQFGDIIKAIDDLDADVISFEAARSDFSLLDILKATHFQTHVGPGVYDIHSPRIPSKDEIVHIIHEILKRLPADHVWINPDCGLKTRDVPETKASLINMVAAAKQVRKELTHENQPVL